MVFSLYFECCAPPHVRVGVYHARAHTNTNTGNVCYIWQNTNLGGKYYGGRLHRGYEHTHDVFEKNQKTFKRTEKETKNNELMNGGIRKSFSLRLILAMIPLLFSCEKYSYEYYPNGKLKSKSEKYNGARTGTYLEYFENGNLKLQQNWSEGKLDGEENEYYPGGKLRSSMHHLLGIPVSEKRFFENGLIDCEIFYKSNGELDDAKLYYESGGRDSLAVPVFAFKPYFSDTLSVDEPALLEATIVNITDSIFLTGTLIISSHLEREENGFVLPVDTVQVIRGVDRIYQYKFLPNKLGQNSILGVFRFERDIGEEVEVTHIPFSENYYVVPNQRKRERLPKYGWQIEI